MNKRQIISAAVMLAVMPTCAQRQMTVDELFSLIDKSNTSLKAQQTGIESASEGIENAKAQRLPDIQSQLSLSFLGDVYILDKNFSHGEGYSSPHFGKSFSVEAQQALYTGGALTAGIKMAELNKQMAEVNLNATRKGLRFAALGKYLDLQKLDNGIKVYDENISLTQKLIADIKAKQEQGMALRNDITRYELQMENLKLGKKKLEDTRAILNHQLCTSIGIADEKIVPDVKMTEISYGREGEQHWQTRALTSAPELTRSGIATQMAEQQLKIAKSDMLPKIAVVAGDNINGPYIYDIPPKDIVVNNWYVGVGIKYSLSNLYKSRRKISQSKLNLQQSRENTDVVKEDLNNRMQEAYTLYLQSYTELETQQKSVQLAQQNYEVVNDRYLNQLALITDMVDASNIKLNAQLKEVDARINIIFAYYKLKFISGEI